MSGINLIGKLQNLNVLTMDFDEAVLLSTQAEALREGYKRHQLASPEWLDDAIRTLDRFIGEKVNDTLEMELRQIKQANAADMTSAERRDTRAKRQAEIEARLGKAHASTTEGVVR